MKELKYEHDRAISQPSPSRAPVPQHTLFSYLITIYPHSTSLPTQIALPSQVALPSQTALLSQTPVTSD
ncbi:unnamed protein product [Rhizophagus irregularis]|nr:unnamed protein product [Rhizophagus irregularis]